MSTHDTAATSRWEHFPHDADLGVRGFGATVEQAFEAKALALTAAVSDADIAPLVTVEVKCEAPDLEFFAGRLAQRGDFRDGCSPDGVRSFHGPHRRDDA